jgi:cellulose synthase/poly-beta-1,6-N-acetylglucosamine synthase-like glycosyltransferase
MCFSADVLQKFPWGAYSITEDLEYGLNLLLHNTSVVFAPEAVVYARMPEQAKNAESQRARWESGRLSVIRAYAGKLFWNALKNRSFKVLDALIDLLTPAFVNMLVLATAMGVLTLLLTLVGVHDAEPFVTPWVILEGFAAAYVIIGLLAARADMGLYKTLLYFPRYALWKMMLYVKLLVYGRPERWVRTTREQSNVSSALHNIAHRQ